MKTRYTFISFLMLAVLSLGFSQNAFAQASDPSSDYEESKGVIMNKNATYDYANHRGTITLESFVEGYQKIIRYHTSADIVLVLDDSGSMEDDETNLKKSAKALVDAMSALLEIDEIKNDENVDYRISVVFFDAYAYLMCDLLSLREEGNADKIKNIIDLYYADGGTDPMCGFYWAKAVLDGSVDDVMKNSSKSSLDDDWYKWYNPNSSSKSHSGHYRTSTSIPTLVGPNPKNIGGTIVFPNRYVIFFTDGVIETNTSRSDTYVMDLVNKFKDGSAFSSGPNATVYAVPLIANLGTGYKLEYSTKYLQVLSSNFQGENWRDMTNSRTDHYIEYDGDSDSNLKKFTNKYTTEILAEHERMGFYVPATNSASIATSFSKIASEIKIGCAAAKLTEETVLKDYINSDWFSLPQDVKATNANIKDYVFAYKVPVKTITGTGDSKVYTFDYTQKTLLNDEVTIKMTTGVEDGNDYITVEGFNFSADENWVGFGADNNPKGYEMLVEIPFQTNQPDNTGELPTNTPQSGVYEPGHALPAMVYNVPKIDFLKLTIVREGLDKGETAIYEVTDDATGEVIWRAALNGTGETEVKRVIAGIPEGSYTVHETGWNWAYQDQSDIQVTLVSGGTNTAKFTSAHKEAVDDNDPAHLHNHDEAYKVNHMNFPESE